MRVAIAKEPLKRLLKWAQRALFACAALLLGYCGFALADAWNFQRRESGDLDRLLRAQRAAGEGTALPSSTTMDGLVGRIEIPRLRLSVVVAEGIGRITLRHAAGHIPGTALPGQPGNIGVAGHRDTFFRGLKDLKTQDEIQFSALGGDFRYLVESLSIVEPDDVGVLAPSSENELTLVTCYPFFYVGTAPKRFIVRARQVSPQTAAPSTVE
jgi:sortase A